MKYRDDDASKGSAPGFQECRGWRGHFDRLVELGPRVCAPGREFEAMRNSLHGQLQADAEGVLDEVLDLVLEMNLDLLLRNGVQLRWLLASYDPMIDKGTSTVPREALPMIERLQAQERTLLELLALRARTRHVRQLAAKKRNSEAKGASHEREPSVN